MLLILCNFVTGPRMFRWIEALYSSPTTQIWVNGILAEPFLLYNGTRQGCPLSSLLLILSLDPFLATIRVNQGIEGIEVSGQEHKLSAIADNIMLYIQYQTPCKRSQIF